MLPWVVVPRRRPSNRGSCLSHPDVAQKEMIPGAYNERVEMVLFASSHSSRLGGPASHIVHTDECGRSSQGDEAHAKPLRDRGWDWKKITDAWNEKTGETLTRNAADDAVSSRTTPPQRAGLGRPEFPRASTQSAIRPWPQCNAVSRSYSACYRSDHPPPFTRSYRTNLRDVPRVANDELIAELRNERHAPSPHSRAGLSWQC